MPSAMPEFEMPSQPQLAAGSTARAGTTASGAPGHDSPEEEPEDEPADEPDDEHGLSAPRIRARLVAGAIVVGLALTAGATAVIIQGVQRAAQDGAVSALTAVSLEYLEAIAAGRGDAATALVPVDDPAPLLTDAALADASRIQQSRVEAVALLGDAATVDVAFLTGHGRIERSLDAVLEDGIWRLTTTLAEHVVLDGPDERPLPQLLGVEIGSGDGTLLYPATYRSEPITEGLVTFRPTTLVVDGDPDTATAALSPRWAAADGLEEQAPSVALAHAVACQATGSCAAPPDALLGAGGVVGSRPGDAGSVELDVIVRVLGSAGPSQIQVAVRASPTATRGIDWRCSGPVVLDGESVPPVEREWEACG